MGKFTMEECNLMCIYDTGTKDGLLAELTEMQSHLQPDETELLELTYRVVEKLTAMTDGSFCRVLSAFSASLTLSAPFVCPLPGLSPTGGETVSRTAAGNGIRVSDAP